MNLSQSSQLLAQITNPAISSSLGAGGATSSPWRLANLIATTWQALFTLAGLAVLAYMAMGAVAWITAGGDKTKIESAKDRITNAVIGITILFSIFALTAYVFPRIGFNLLQPNLPDNLGIGGSLQ